MNEYILKLREFSLRKVILWSFVAAIVLSVLAWSILGQTFTMIIAFVFIALIYIAIAVNCIDKDDKALIVSYILMIYCLLGLANSIYMLSDLNIGSAQFSEEFGIDVLFGTNAVQKRVANTLISHSFLALLSNLVAFGAYAYGLMHINKKYLAPWIMILISYAINTYQAYTLSTGGYTSWDSYSSITNLGSIIGLIGMLIILFIGGKSAENKTASYAASSTENVSRVSQAHTTVNHDAERTTESKRSGEPPMSEKSKQLFQLKELMDSGILSQEEFDSEKKKILNS